MDPSHGGYGLEKVYPPTEEHLSGEIQADIIFVHGLNGDSQNTWTVDGHNGRRICWMSTNGFLPSMIPLSRIFTFKYNARILNYNSDAGLEDISRSLLSQIQSVRKERREINRKLIFVCHSLGGLVVKQAMILDTQDDSLKNIQDHTVGVITLGTPHGGSHLGITLTRISFVTGTSKEISRTLSVKSEPLESLNKAFEGYYLRRYKRTAGQAPRLAIRSFGEMHRTPVFFPFTIKVVPLSLSKTNLPGEVWTPVEKDHHSICRFETPTDPVFVMIWQQLSDWMAQPNLGPLFRSATLQGAETFTGDKYYEVPLETENFIGREDDLQKLEDALSPRKNEPHHSVGIYGPGGIGKTQLALRYAYDNQDEYRTVKFFNARSEKDLKASIEKFFDYLISRKDERLLSTAGKDCKDKCAAVLKWFEDERKWLLVYDDADFDPAYDPSVYFPKHAYGHIILIGRGSKVKAYTESSMELHPLKRPDAIDMLLKRSTTSIQPPTANSKEIAQVAGEIVDELAGSPGFIEAAAKYILHAKPTLKEYLLMLRNQKQNKRLHSAKGLLGDAFASWELTLNKLKSEPKSMLLLKLFVFLDGANISTILRTRALAPAKRWNLNGEKIDVTPTESGISQELIDLFQNPEEFDRAITPLIQASFLRRDNSGSSSRIEMMMTIQHFVQWNLSTAETLNWTKQAICIVSHCLPEEPSLDNRFESVRTELTPHIFRCVDHSRQFSISELDEVLPQLTSMLLASLARSGMELNYTDKLVESRSDGYYRCLAAKWRGYELFFADRKREAEQLIAGVQASEELLAEENGTPENPRAHAALGDLIMHRAQFLFNEGRYDESEKAIKSWKPMSDSTLEKRSEIYLKTALDKVRVARGEIDLAIEHLKEIVSIGQSDSGNDALQESDVNWATVILCQIYCFQGEKESYTSALAELEPRITALITSESQGEFITSDFRILKCEALMGLGRFQEAETELETLQNDLRLPTQVGNPRAPSQLACTKRMKARCYHSQKMWAEAITAWTEALQQQRVSISDITSGEFEKKYDIVVSIYSLGVAYLHQGEKIGKKYVEIAKAYPPALKYPDGKTDYTRWLAKIEDEHLQIESSRNFISRLFHL